MKMSYYVSPEGIIFDEDGPVNQYLQKYGKRGQKYWTTKYGASHRLIADALVPNPNNKSEVDHINEIATDNRPENLRWVTQKENKALHMCKNIYYVKTDKHTYVTYNLSEFCKTYKLDTGALRKTSAYTKAKDKRNHHKGYSIALTKSLDLQDRDLQQILLPFVEIL